MLQNLPIDLVEKIFKNFDINALYDRINESSGCFRGISFFAIGMQYNTENARELYEMVKMIGCNRDINDDYCIPKNQLILHMPTITGIDSCFDKYGLTYEKNCSKWEPLGSVDVPGFSQCAGNNNKFNIMAGEFLDHLLHANKNALSENNYDTVVMSQELKEKIKATDSLLAEYKQFVAGKVKEMLSTAIEYKFTEDLFESTKRFLKSDLVDYGLGLFCRVTPLGLIYLSILGALRKEYTSNYDATKSMASGRHYGVTIYKKRYCNDLVIPVGINNAYTINF